MTKTITVIGISTLIFIPLVGVLLNVYFQMRGLSAPPKDFGSGSMFDKIAHRYDFINRALALNLDLSWRRTMIHKILELQTPHQSSSSSSSSSQTPPPLHYLDLATGTADVAILLAEELQRRQWNGDVYGVDPSPNMISVGRTKVGDRQLSNRVTLTVGDARDLSTLPMGYYDAVTMSFGIRNVPERNVVLCQIRNVLKPLDTARVAILEFSEPEGGTLLEYGAKLFIRYVVPVVGAVLSGAPREYMHLQNSIKDFPSPKEFVTLIEGVECDQGDDTGSRGRFEVESVEHMNFGSVQLYLAKPI